MLEFYSRHYGRVYTGQDEPLPIRDALLGINQVLDDEQHPEAKHPPEDAEPLTRLYLQIFNTRSEIPRDELHKTLHGTTRTQKELEDERGWVQETDKIVYRASIPARFERFRQRPRKEMKTDLDQAHFLIGAAIPGSGVNIAEELQREGFALKKSVDGILTWYADTEVDETLRSAASLASQLVSQWRADQEAKKPRKEQLAMEL